MPFLDENGIIFPSQEGNGGENYRFFLDK